MSNFNSKRTPSGAVRPSEIEWVQRLARSIHQGSGASSSSSRPGSSPSFWGSSEDLAQETWVRILEKGRPDDIAPRAWLAGILKNVARESVRKDARRKRREQEASKPEAWEARETEICIDLMSHVDALDEPLGRALRQRYMDGLSVQQIAAQEGLKEAGVRSRIHRAHERLRDRLGSHPQSLAGAWLIVATFDMKRATLASATATSSAGAAASAFSIGRLASVVMLASIAGIVLIPFLRPSATPKSADGPVRASEQAEPLSTVETAALRQPIEVQDPRSRLVAAAPPSAIAVSDAPVAGAQEPQTPAGPSHVRVRVFGPDGQAIPDIPIAISASGTMAASRPSRTQTNAQGYIDLDHATIQRSLNIRDVKTAYVGVAGPLGAETMVPLPQGAFPTDPIDIQLAWNPGTCIVRCFDAAGELLTEPLSVRAALAQDSGGTMRVVSTKIGTDGVARLWPVPVGERLRLTAYRGRRWRAPRLVVEGPESMDSPIEAELHFPPSQPTVVATIVSPNNEPLADSYDVDFNAQLVEDPTKRVYTRGELERGGRMYVVVTPSSVEGKRCMLSIGAKSPDHDDVLTARVDITVPSAGETLDLGRIVAQPQQPAITGRVVDADGTPVAGALVAVLQRAPRVEGKPQRDWSVNASSIERSDGRGEFVVTSVPPGFEIGVRATVGRVQSKVHAVEAGAHRIEIAMPRRQDASAKLLLHDDVPATTLQVGIDRLAGDDRGFRRARDVGPEGRFTLALPDDNEGIVFVRLGSFGPVLYRQPLRELLLSGEDGAMRLKDIDLRRQLVPVDVEVAAADGTPLSFGVAVLDAHGYEIVNGKLKTVIRQEDLDRTVYVAAPGHQTSELTGAELRGEIALQRGIEVEVLIEDDLASSRKSELAYFALVPLEAPWRRALVVTSTGGTSVCFAGEITATTAPIDANGRATVTVPNPGSYAGELRASKTLSERADMAPRSKKVTIDAQPTNRVTVVWSN